jgi:hypothetical protein
MKSLFLNLPAETDLAAILAVPVSAPLLPPLGSSFWRERFARPPLRRILAPLRSTANEEAEHPLPPLTDALYADYHATGIRQRFEAVYFERRRRLARALFCALADGPESELVPSAVRKLQEVFEEVAWELPAHVSSPDGKDPTVIGLFAAETAHLMAQCACLLGDALPDDLRHRIRARLDTQITDAYLTRGEELFWPRETDNWNAVCHQGILGAALLLEDNPNRLARLLHAAAPRLARFLDGFAADGGCTEGPTYWAYGFGAFMALNEQLEWRSNGRFSLLAGQEERMRAIARYGVTVTLAGGCVVNFADSQGTPLEAHGPLLAYLSRRLNEPACMELAQVMYGEIEEHGMDMNSPRCDVFYLERLLRHCPEGRPPTVLPQRFDALPDLQVFVARGPDSHGVYWEFAAKGGHNGEHHNHNDCGTYVVHLDGVPAIVEMGRPEYTSETFGPRRYECNATRSRGHSVPVINGCEQAEGAEHAARVVQVTASDGHVEIVFDLTRCYPQEAGCTSCVRKFVFEPGQLRVVDTIQLAAAGEVETAVILPDSEEQRVRIEPSDGTVLAAAEILHYRSPDNPDAVVQRLVLKPPAPSTTILLAYTVWNNA